MQAILLAVAALVLLFMLAGVLTSMSFFAENRGEPLAYLVHAFLVAGGCFFICRNKPKSVWYVPLLANMFVFASAVTEPNFWTTSLWFWFGISLPLSVLAGFLGSWKSRVEK